MIKKLSEHSELYDHDDEEEDGDYEARSYKGTRKTKRRYEYLG